MPASSPTSSPDESTAAGREAMIFDAVATRNRRQVLVGIGAALAAPISYARPVRAAVASFRTTVGAIEIMVISDGILNVPMSLTLPETPTSEATALFAAHGLPAAGTPAQTNVALVKTGAELVIIDAGAGANFQPTAGKLSDNLQAAGVNPEAVSKVVFTHGHPDHLWGAIDEFDEHRFPKASYVISAAEWDYWTRPNTPTEVPDWQKGMALAAARILRRLDGRIERRKAGDIVAPGLRYVDSAGHTPGHMSVLVESGNERLLVGGDVLTHVAISFARPRWRIGTDHDRNRAVATRLRTLDWLSGDRLRLIGFHLPWPGHGMVERKDMAYRFIAH
jgi:glyoxylase-like metal-dependent hydrolase (beta-lactamase superfamily II)